MKTILGMILTVSVLGASAFATTGTGHSGGGNIYRGRPLDSYVVNPKKLPAYTQVLAEVRERTKHWLVGNLFDSMLEDRTWYLLPGPLEKIPSSAIGSSVATDQAALQNFESVWIDSDHFGAMTVAEQADLVLHEVLMGIKLLRFESDLAQCQAKRSGSECAGLSKRRRGQPGDLNSKDYNQIRKSVAEFLELREIPVGDSSLGQKSESILARNEFNFGMTKFNPAGEPKISARSVSQILDAAFFGEEWPTRLFRFQDLLAQNPGMDFRSIEKELTWEPTGECRFLKFKYSAGPQDGMILESIYERTVNGKKTVHPIKVWAQQENSISQFETMGESTNYIALTPVDDLDAKPGQKDIVLVLIYASGQNYYQASFVGIQLQERVMIANENGSRQWIYPKNGIFDICSTRSVMKFFP